MLVMALKFLSGLETNRLTGWNCYLFAGSRITTDAPLAGLDHKNAKASELDTLAARQGLFHRMKKSINSLLGLHFGNARAVSHTVNDIEFDHAFGLRRFIRI